MGRPRLPADEKMSEAVCVRFTPGEMKAIKRVARKQDRRPGRVVRDLALAQFEENQNR